jgi:hypothetical protein
LKQEELLEKYIPFIDEKIDFVNEIIETFKSMIKIQGSVDYSYILIWSENTEITFF